MTQLTLLSGKQRKAFDNTPIFSQQERQLYFHLGSDTRRHIAQLKSPINRLGYMLQMGYFKATAKFYPASEFRGRDISYVKRLLGIKKTAYLSLEQYQPSTQYDHQKRLLKYLDWRKIGDHEKIMLTEKAELLASQQKKPVQLFYRLIDFCWKHQIVIPSYTELSVYVTDSYNAFEAKALHRLSTQLDTRTTEVLNELVQPSNDSRHTITLLKPINQSLKPMEIAKSVETCNTIGHYFVALEPVIEHLDLTDQATEHLAKWVQKAQTFQLTRLASQEKIYLHLLAFIKHQYCTRQDALTHAFLKSVRKSVNLTTKRLNANEISTRKERNDAIKSLTKASKTARQLVEDIQLVSGLKSVTASEKYYKIETLLKEFENQQNDEDRRRIEALESRLAKSMDEEGFYTMMESLSRSLQRSVSGVLKSLVFNEKNSSTDLLEAIAYFKSTDGKITEKAPVQFLKPNEHKYITKDEGFNISLYKYLLFLHCADGIKSGDLNLKYSYEFRSINDYLIPQQEWEKDREKLLRMAELDEYADIDSVLLRLKSQLDQKYQETNDTLNQGKNSYLSFNAQGRVHIKTPRTDYDEREYIGTTLAQNGYVPIQQVLTEVNDICGYSETFTHYAIKHTKMKPTLPAIIAGVIGMGCNIGINKLANISLGVSESSLKNTVNWLFDLRNIQAANNTIVQTINNLNLAKSYQKSASRIHSSSDGRKVGVAVDSLLANRSFKYFGKDQGVVVYTFIDERQSLFHSTVISASDREAPYVIDGLLHNDVQQNTIHSVDEHGFSEAVHAATHLTGTSFAPRFKQIGNKCIYAFCNKKTYQRKGYKVLPNGTINQKMIKKEWDNVLRFMATIKTGRTSASQLFKRLSSYAKQHPLYKALKEFGKTIKSIYILTYCNDVELRQDVQKNLNRIELSNKFSNAVFFDNDQEFRVGTPEEQEVASACKVLIQNAVVLWNYLYLSDMLVKIDDEEERQELIDTIHKGSVICWRHINLRGTYDFRRKAANGARFDMEEIRRLKIA